MHHKIAPCMCPAPYADGRIFFPFCDGIVSGISISLQIFLEVSQKTLRMFLSPVSLILIQDDLAFWIPFSASVKPHETIGGGDFTGF